MTKLAAWILAAALAALPSLVVAEDKSAAEPSISKAVPLTDAQLDAITAGTALTANIITNPGNAVKFDLDGNHISCVNCAGGSDKGALVIHFVQNPAQTFIKCGRNAC